MSASTCCTRTARSRRLLAGAVELKTALGDLRVISTEGLIGFKLQGGVNDPRRTQDLEDIRVLLRDQPIAGDGGVHMPVTAPKDPYRTLDDLMAVVETLCPRWPMRETFVGADGMLL